MLLHLIGYLVILFPSVQVRHVHVVVGVCFLRMFIKVIQAYKRLVQGAEVGLCNRSKRIKVSVGEGSFGQVL